MLLDTVKRYDTHKQIKLVSVDALRIEKKRIPPQIHSVPALYILEDKGFIYGKQVFDYLLLPGRGKLLVSMSSDPSSSMKHSNTPSTASPDGPSAYSMINGIADSYTMIDDEKHPTNGMDDRAYSWTPIEELVEDNVRVPANTPFSEETRMKKEPIDIDAYKARRDLELRQSDLNTTQLSPPSFSR